MVPGRFTERRQKAANWGAHAGETIAGRLVRSATGRFGSADATTSEAEATVARNLAANAAHAPKRGRSRKPKKGKAPKKAHAPKKTAAPKKAHVPKRRRSLSGQRRQLARQQAHHAKVAKAIGLQEDGAGALLDLAQGKRVDDDGGLAKMGLAMVNKDGTYSLTAAGVILAKAADDGDTHLAQYVIDAIATVPTTTTKATDGHTGVMVAFYLAPFVADALGSATGAARGVTAQPVDELHCTLAYLGKTDELEGHKYQIIAGVERYAQWASAVLGTINGTGRFGTVEDDDTNALYASVDAPDLQAWRDNLVQTLADNSGILPLANHGYTPHITLAYLPATARIPTLSLPSIPVLFDTLSLAWGDERYDFPLAASSPMVFKDAAGSYRWITISSSSFRDRDKEIVSTKALETDVARADADGTYGPLRWWHMPGIDLGDCDFNAMSGRLLIESGTFYSEAIAERVKAAAPTLQVSIGFLHPAAEPDGDGVFSTIRRFERSLLPSGYASNPYTRLVVAGDQPMAMNETKKAAARALFGDDVFEKLMMAAEQTEKAADAAGVAFKAAPVATPDPTPPPPAAAADEGADDDAGTAVGDMDVAEFTGMLKEANQPLVDVMTALVNAFTGTAQQTAQQTATKEAAVDTRLTAAEQEVATLKQKLATAEQQVTELRGDLPASIASRRASQSAATLLPTGTTKAAELPSPDIGFMGFITGEQPKQGA